MQRVSLVMILAGWLLTLGGWTRPAAAGDRTTTAAALAALGGWPPPQPPIPRPGNNQAALDQCGRITDWDLANRCQLAASRHSYYDQAAVDQCGRISSNEWLAQCIAWAGDFVFDQGALDQCGRVSDNEWLARCVGGINGKRYFDAGALAACGRVSDNQQLAICLYDIGDRHYASTDIDWCNRAPTNEALVQCLAQRGQWASPLSGN